MLGPYLQFTVSSNPILNYARSSCFCDEVKVRFCLRGGGVYSGYVANEAKAILGSCHLSINSPAAIIN